VDAGTIEVTASCLPFAFMYAVVRATIQVDGKVVARGWGTHSIAVEPGQHLVEVSYPWLPKARRIALAAATVQVAAGETVRVRYKPRVLQFLPGKIRVEAPIPRARLVR
jgi:hypothetical protein